MSNENTGIGFCFGMIIILCIVLGFLIGELSDALRKIDRRIQQLESTK